MYYLMQCPCCGNPILLHQLERHTAKSLLIDPETGLPPNIDPATGAPRVPTAEAMKRSRRRAVCSSCMKEQEETGAITFVASARQIGEQEALGFAEETPLVDDQGAPMAVRCPSVDCEEIVSIMGGKIERHFVRGKECPLSGIKVMA